MIAYYKEHKNIFYAFLILVFIIYGNTLKNKYALDDEYITVTNYPTKGKEKEYIPNHTLVSKGISAIPKIWQSRYAHDSEGAFDYRPVAATTFAIEYSIFGQNPFVSHLVNLLLYFTCVWLIYCVLTLLLRNHVQGNLIPFLAALIFLIHPIHTEVVNNLKCRDELLCFVFCFASLWFCLKAHDKPHWKYLLLIIVCLALAIFSKLTAKLFLVLIPLTLFFFRKINIKQIIILLFIIVFIYFLFPFLKRNIVTEEEVRRFYHFENPFYTDDVSFIHRIIVSIKTLGFYIKSLIFPNPLKVYYGVNTFDMSKTINWYFFVAIAFLIVTTYYFLKSKNRIALFAFLMFCAAIAPFTNIATPAPGIVAERFVYVASFGFSLLLAVIISPYFKQINFNHIKQFTQKPFLAITPIILICTIYIWNRNNTWHDKITLLEHDIKYLDNSAKANSLMANEYMEMLHDKQAPKYPPQTLIQKCIFHYDAAIRNDSTLYTAYNNIGVIYFSFLNDLVKAENYFRLATKIRPKYAQAYENIGNCLKAKNQPDSAIYYYKQAILSKPKQYSAYTSWYEILFNQKKYNNCISLMNVALSNFVDNYELTVNKANCFLMKGDTTNALLIYETAYQIFPNQNLVDFLNKKYQETGSKKSIGI